MQMGTSLVRDWWKAGTALQIETGFSDAVVSRVLVLKWPVKER